MPIYLAARGPKMLELTGEMADGALLASLPLNVIDQAIKKIKAGTEKAGRSFDGLDITYLLRFSVSKDGEEARELAKPRVAYGIADSPPYVIEGAEIEEEEQRRIKETLKEKGVAAAADLVTEEMIDAFAVAGTPEECIEKCSHYMKHRITQLVFGPPIGPRPHESLKLTYEKIVHQLPTDVI